MGISMISISSSRSGLYPPADRGDVTAGRVVTPAADRGLDMAGRVIYPAADRGGVTEGRVESPTADERFRTGYGVAGTAVACGNRI